jgi:hypothetical protein
MITRWIEEFGIEELDIEESGIKEFGIGRLGVRKKPASLAQTMRAPQVG